MTPLLNAKSSEKCKSRQGFAVIQAALATALLRVPQQRGS